MKNFSFQTRKNNIEKMKDERFDLLIIGGGITGAGVARDAAMRGLKVALVEANDFAFGTSSRSSKLVHGGIRYLENYEFHLVFEALSERAKLFQNAPHLVHPLRFMIPLFENSRVSSFKMGLGMMLYDALALFQTPEMHEKLTKIETLQRMPIVRGSDLVGSFVYSDGYMDDDRLVHETMRSANEAGACVANYVEVTKAYYSQNHVTGVQVRDKNNQNLFDIECDHVISTVGPWTDLVGAKLVDDWKKILRPTKGVHITLHKDRLNLSSAVVMAAQKSSRIVFAIPRHEMIIIGTTDTDFQDAPEKAKVTADDIAYLLRVTNEYFPGAKITENDILSTYVGVRPLVKDGSDIEGKTSREHTILSDPRGFTFVAGGKYTTYRLMSEQIVDRALKSFPIEKRLSLNRCDTNKPLNYWTTPTNYEQALYEAKDSKEKFLAQRYGMEAFQILSESDAAFSVWQLEAKQAIQHTMCLNLVDFYVRRVPLMLGYRNHGLQFLDEILEVFKAEMGWNDSEVNHQLNALKNLINEESDWRSRQ